jgi:hypothetical protein
MPVRLSSIQLVRFAKVWLAAGESKTVHVELAARDLGYWDDGMNGTPDVPAGGMWRVDAGLFELYIGTAGFTSWRDPGGLTTTLNVTTAV